MAFSHLLMEENITREDINELVAFLQTMPRLTQSGKVREFEEAWSRWLGVKYSLYVNSGASANLLTIAAFKYYSGFNDGEIIVPPLTWVSDIASVMHNGFTPIFADIDPRHLGMAEEEILKKITPQTRAVFLTYVQGFNCLSDRLLNELRERGIALIEDVCESHGATFKGRRLGSFGLASNFSFYFAHHMSTIEGGMFSTDCNELYQIARMLRSHGMVRESNDEALKKSVCDANPELSPDFIFVHPAWNMRGTEIGGVLGLAQLKRLDANNERRTENFKLFLELLDSAIYRTDFELEGSSNYAFPLVLKKSDFELRDRLEDLMRRNGIEFRRGNAGGGNQMRQPYLKELLKEQEYLKYPEVEHIHHLGYYVGNYPTLDAARIRQLVEILNSVR